MIFDDGLRDAVAAAAFAAAWFCAGVTWAAYRAVGWVDRMRAWAAATEKDTTNTGAGQ